ncbi:hypothetical protein GXN76_00855 [Kroppenstedtia pulmonis]|uniref:Uncharacterized protein n=1 Tax=Kroppenstedtia pulmonis TaxID=1380685 RepID=A0A7D4BN99_9BACL|nr:hypothetical protein [Kroppenstedtia pulmonis]QKG83151.1 hypothetical protein GXN76_00855 [Kroppenstedtia pulmonis]
MNSLLQFLDKHRPHDFDVDYVWSYVIMLVEYEKLDIEGLKQQYEAYLENDNFGSQGIVFDCNDDGTIRVSIGSSVDTCDEPEFLDHFKKVIDLYLEEVEGGNNGETKTSEIMDYFTQAKKKPKWDPLRPENLHPSDQYEIELFTRKEEVKHWIKAPSSEAAMEKAIKRVSFQPTGVSWSEGVEGMPHVTRIRSLEKGCIPDVEYQWNAPCPRCFHEVSIEYFLDMGMDCYCAYCDKHYDFFDRRNRWYDNEINKTIRTEKRYLEMIKELGYDVYPDLETLRKNKKVGSDKVTRLPFEK